MSELISIIMPVKNASPWLSECVQSILEQDYHSWELIAIDDHSTDDSKNLLEKAAAEDDRIKVFKNDGSGIIEALNTARSKATGNWITRMDADDIMPSNKLSLFFDKLGGNENAIVTGKVGYFSNEEISAGYREYEDWINERVEQKDHNKWIYRECTVAGANWMTHNSNVDWEKLEYPEDYDLVFHWYQKGCSIICVNEVTHRWRDHGKRTSKNSEHYEQKAFFDLKIQRFLELDYDSTKSLFILGDNKKTKLCRSVLDSRKVQYKVLTQDDIDLLGPHLEAQILVAVFPSKFERQQIVQFLDYNRLEEGSNWWWL